MTYGQLDQRATQIASSLRDVGVIAGTLVAVYLDRSPNLIASLLGIWKVGAAYLPIDPANPIQRIVDTIEDSQADFALTERALKTALPATAAKVLCVDDFISESATPGPTQSRPGAEAQSPGQLAYVIYTSGSTGRPKGVKISHGGLSNVIASIGRDVALQPSDVVLASTTIAFDISNEEIFLPLVAGASVHLLERESVGNGRKLIEVLRRSGTSLVFGTPTSWRLLLEAGWRGDRDLQIIVGGEVLPLSLAHTLAGMVRVLWNHYGPTEASICATRERVLAGADAVTLGQPIDNVQIYILDEQLRPVSVGAPGEICIGGAGVGLGYLHCPELTARAFVPDPFSDQPDARMYRTGDLGCLLPDGRIDFRGRSDHQIKLRGFRIELEEIEAAIREFGGVHAAVVELVEYGVDDQRLVAYFLHDDLVDPAVMREFLRRKLPPYMVPSELVPLHSLPMTANGKIDRQALSAIRVDFESRPRPVEGQSQAKEFETELLTIWQKVFHRPNLGPSDDFFDLGGHSLLAARILAGIEKLTGRKLPLSVLIQHPTARELATHIRSKRETGWPGLMPIREQGDAPPLFLAHGLGSNLLLFRELVDALGPDQPVYGVQLAARADAPLEELRIEDFARRYVEEICAVDPVGPYCLAGHSLGGFLAFEIAAQLRDLGKEIGLLALLDCDFHVAQRAHKAPPQRPIQVKDVPAFVRKKRDRFLADGLRNVISRKLRHNWLMFKIWVVRYVLGEGTYFPNFLGIDPYIALSAERYKPQAIDEGAVLFVAAERPAPELAASGWLQVIRGRLEVEYLPGSHHTFLIDPQVALLAELLGRRMTRSARSPQQIPATNGNDFPGSTLHPQLEYHGD